MQFPGYWVWAEDGKVVVERSVFDETELDPETNWKQAWQNQEAEGMYKGFVDLEEALSCVAQMFAARSGRALTSDEVACAKSFGLSWQGDRAEVGSLDVMLKA